MLISGLSVLLLERHPRATSKNLAFVIVFSLNRVFLVVLRQQKHDFALDGLIVGQHVFKSFPEKMAFSDFWGGVGFWGFGVAKPL